MSLTPSDTALDASYPARPSEIAAIRRAVSEAARAMGAREEALLQISLAVSEAATNAVRHAYGGRGLDDAGDVRVVVRANGGEGLEVRVRDQGTGLTPGAGSKGAGLGLWLMAHETERFEIHKVPGGGTEVVLRFPL
jgi:serine/threonine-protein kinase RsbW